MAKIDDMDYYVESFEELSEDFEVDWELLLEMFLWYRALYLADKNYLNKEDFWENLYNESLENYNNGDLFKIWDFLYDNFDWKLYEEMLSKEWLDFFQKYFDPDSENWYTMDFFSKFLPKLDEIVPNIKNYEILKEIIDKPKKGWLFSFFN